MEEQQPEEQRREYSLQALFAAKDKGLPGYVELLAGWGKLKLCNAEEFNAYLIKIGKPEVAKQLSNQILQLEVDRKKTNKNHGENLPIFFPIVKHSNQIFQQRILEQFFIEITKERIYLQFSEKDQQSFSEQFDDLVEIKQEEEIEPQSQISKIQSSKKTDKLETKKPQKKLKFGLPWFFDLKYKSINTWMAINVTQEFKKQLQEVKQLLRQQFMKNDWVIQTYQSFLIDFLIYRSILEGKYETCIHEEQNTEKIDKLKRLALKASQLNSLDAQQYQFLQQILKDLLKDVEIDVKQEDITQIVRKICLKSLDNVYLTSNMTALPYGNTLNGIILININHISKELDIEKLRQGPLRPYIALTLYHQIAHFLVREYLQERLNEFNSSFSTDKDSIGKNFIETIKSLSRQTTVQSVSLLYDPKQTSKTNLKKFDEDIKRFQIYFEEFQKQILFFENKVQIFRQIKETLEVLSFPYRFGLQQRGKYLKAKWSQIYSYIDSLNNDEQHYYEDMEKEMKFRLFFSLLLSNAIVQKWLEDCKQPYENWTVSKRKLINFKKQTTFFKHYYIKPDYGMDKIVENTIGDIYNSIKQDTRCKYEISKYIENILFKDCFTEINEQISSILEQASYLNLYPLKEALEDSVQRMTTITIKVRQSINIDDLINMRLESLAVQKNLKKIRTILNINQAIYITREIRKKTPLWRIMVQLPNFFTISSVQRAFQSGFQIQKRLIRRADIENIYTKDFDLMKNINNPANRAQIGVQPKDQNEKRQRIIVAKEGKKRGLKVDIKKIGCGVYLRNQMNARIKEFQKRKQEKMKKSTTQVSHHE